MLDVAPPAVLSVEGGVARLRRATLAAELAARTAPVEEVDGPARARRDRRRRAARTGRAPVRWRRRPAARSTGSAAYRRRPAPTAHELAMLDPPDAAARILAALREWGYR